MCADLELEYRGYSQAYQGAVFYPVPEAGYLLISGRDRLAFLQRLSTNDLTRLAPGKSLLTVLANPSARILDVLRLLLEGDGSLAAITLPGHARDTMRFLKGRIFFRDEVSVSDESGSRAQVDLDGRAAGEVLLGLGFTALPHLDEVVEGVVDGVVVRALGQPGFFDLGYRLLVANDGWLLLRDALLGRAAMPIPLETYHVLRLEAGLPAAGFELTSDYNPLEVGLSAAVAEQKGCYPGQEVLARQVTYDKLTRGLVGLRPEAPVTRGARITADGKPVGLVTSAAISPNYGPIALAVLRRPYNQPGRHVIIEAEGLEGGIPALVSLLPFRAVS